VFDERMSRILRADPRVGARRPPNAQRAAAEVLSLPMHPSLERDDLRAILGAVGAGLA